MKRLLIYAVGQALSRSASILLLPFYTRVVPPEQYGRADLALSTGSVLVSIILVEIWSGALRGVIGAKRSRASSRAVISSTIAFLVVAFPVYAAAQLGLNAILGLGFGVVTLVYGASLAASQTWQSIARGVGDSRGFALSGIVGAVVQVVLVFALLQRVATPGAVLLAAPSAGLLASAVLLEWRNGFLRTFSLKAVRVSEVVRLGKFAAPLAINSVVFWLLGSFSTYYVARLMGFAASAQVAVALKFSAILSVAIGVFTLAWQERAYEESESLARGPYFSAVFATYLQASGVAASLLILASLPGLRLMIGSGFSEARYLVPLYVVATYLSGVGAFIAHIYGAERRTNRLFWSTALGAFVNIVAVVGLVGVLGMVAAPVGLICGQVVNVVSRMWGVRFFVDLFVTRKVVVRAGITLGLSCGGFYAGVAGAPELPVMVIGVLLVSSLNWRVIQGGWGSIRDAFRPGK